MLPHILSCWTQWRNVMADDATLMNMIPPTDEADEQTQQHVTNNRWWWDACDGTRHQLMMVTGGPRNGSDRCNMVMTTVTVSWAHTQQGWWLTCFFLHSRLLVPIGYTWSIHFVSSLLPLCNCHCWGLLLHHWFWLWSVNTHTLITGLYKISPDTSTGSGLLTHVQSSLGSTRYLLIHHRLVLSVNTCTVITGFDKISPDTTSTGSGLLTQVQSSLRSTKYLLIQHWPVLVCQHVVVIDLYTISADTPVHN